MANANEKNDVYRIFFALTLYEKVWVLTGNFPMISASRSVQQFSRKSHRGCENFHYELNWTRSQNRMIVHRS